VTLSGLAVSLCLLAFIVFFDQCIRRLRPAAVAADVARAARATFAQTLRLADRPDVRWTYGATRADPTLVVRAGSGGAIQAQYTSIRGGERVADLGAVPSIGTVGDSYDCEKNGGVCGRV
jgi:hypothetical protein